MSGFKKDLQQEQILTPIIYKLMFDFIDANLGTKSELIKFEDDAEKQYQGIDVVTQYANGLKLFTDIKCQTNDYIGNPTPTFCLELSYLKYGDWRQGWFLDDTKKTDYYLFVWIPQANTKYITNLDDIVEMHLMFVYRKDIVHYLNTEGLTKTNLKRWDDWLRNNSVTKIKKGYSRDIGMTKSILIEEEPINLVLRKKHYWAMEHTGCFIYKPNKYGNSLHMLSKEDALFELGIM